MLSLTELSPSQGHWNSVLWGFPNAVCDPGGKTRTYTVHIISAHAHAPSSPWTWLTNPSSKIKLWRISKLSQRSIKLSTDCSWVWGPVWQHRLCYCERALWLFPLGSYHGLTILYCVNLRLLTSWNLSFITGKTGIQIVLIFSIIIKHLFSVYYSALQQKYTVSQTSKSCMYC